MGSSYLPPPEQNVVNVGDEISASALAGIQAASPSLSQANPAATEDYVTSAIAAIPAPPTNITDYDNFKVYTAGEIVLASNDFYRFNAFIGAAGYGPITHPSAWTKLSSQDLAGYAQLSGATFTGKINATATATTAGVNLGTLLAAPTAPASGDIFITDRLQFINRFGNQIGLVSTNQTSTIQTANNTGAILTVAQTGNGGSLRVVNTGSGYSLRVEDESPESTPFVVGADGRVGIHGDPASNVAYKLAIYNGHIVFSYGWGLAFGDGTFQTTAAPSTASLTASVISAIGSGTPIASSSSTITASISYYDGYNWYYSGSEDFNMSTILYPEVGSSMQEFKFDGSGFNWISAGNNYTQTTVGSFYSSQGYVTVYSDGSGGLTYSPPSQA